MQFRPCIDIHDGKVKQIIGSSLSKDKVDLKTNFVATNSAVYFANLYKRDNLKSGHIIMLDKKEETKQEAIKALKIYPSGLQIGGGIQSLNAKEFLDAGASKVIVSSFIFTKDQLDVAKLKELTSIVGRDNLVLDLSCRKKGTDYYVVIDRWQTFTDFIISADSLQVLSRYCDEFLIHGVDVEGKKQGIDKELLRLLSNFDDIPITYAGGICSLDDIEVIRQIGKGKINFTVGSALDIFGGDLSYKEVVNCLSNK